MPVAELFGKRLEQLFAAGQQPRLHQRRANARRLARPGRRPARWRADALAQLPARVEQIAQSARLASGKTCAPRRPARAGSSDRRRRRAPRRGGHIRRAPPARFANETPPIPRARGRPGRPRTDRARPNPAIRSGACETWMPGDPASCCGSNLLAARSEAARARPTAIRGRRD